jgi:GUN4-like
MKFLNPKEKAKLKEILSRSSQLETADNRINFIKLCGLDSYCSKIQVDQTFDKFFTNLVAVLSQVNIKDKNSESKLELVLFLEHFIEFEHHLSVEDKDSLEYLILKCNKKTSLRTNSQPQNQFLLASGLSIDQDDYQSNYHVYLEQLLAVGEWQEADLETKRILLKLSDKEEKEGLGVNEIKNFSCEVISTVDALWIKYSNGHFGFSIQQQIWQKLLTRNQKKFWEFWRKNTVEEDNQDNWYRFSERVGWCKNNKSGKADWVQYRNISFDLNAQKGHLPCSRELWKGMRYQYESKRFSELMLKIKSCENYKLRVINCGN